jgi:phosphatidyl-myo-inositol alpha-mannosyltransferase
MKKRWPDMAKSAKLKVSLVYDDSLDGHEGVAHQVKLIGSWLAGRGHTVSYLCGQTHLPHYKGSKVYSLARNVKVSFNGNKLSIPLPTRGRLISQTLAEVKPDILHVQLPHSPFMAQKVVNRSSAAAVGTFHIYPANWLVGLGARLLKVAYLGGLNKFTEVVSVSPAAQTFARDYFGLATKVIPNAVAIDQLKSQVHNRPNRVVFLGRLVERKGCEQLIRAFAIVNEMLPEAELIVAGDGPQRPKLAKLVSELGLDNAVSFKGFIKEEAKADLLASAAVACFPSLYGESFGIVLVEAMAAGAGAVLAGNNPGYASVMQPRPELLCNPRDSQQLAAQIIRLLRDDAARAAVSKWQKNYVKQFDINHVGQQLEALYISAIASGRQSRHNNG